MSDHSVLWPAIDRDPVLVFVLRGKTRSCRNEDLLSCLGRNCSCCSTSCRASCRDMYVVRASASQSEDVYVCLAVSIEVLAINFMPYLKETPREVSISIRFRSSVGTCLSVLSTV